ncbi:GrpB family protein [Gaopeijia maritima]|uniref:GrpB family protein n=1 Tax=Gaopeijia maritima TaxID=3119007 RepID=UPI003868CDDA
MIDAFSRPEPLGMIADQPQLVPHDDRWAELFDRLRVSLTRRLGDRILSVHHVGSTSVPGLSAKPILDVLIGVQSLAASLECVPILAELGFEHGPEDDIPDRHYFRGQRGGLRTHHLSLAEESSAHFINSLVFRDALRESPELVRAYETLKRDLYATRKRKSELHRGKSSFVAQVLRERGGVV